MGRGGNSRCSSMASSARRWGCSSTRCPLGAGLQRSRPGCNPRVETAHVINPSSMLSRRHASALVLHAALVLGATTLGAQRVTLDLELSLARPSIDTRYVNTGSVGAAATLSAALWREQGSA